MPTYEYRCKQCDHVFEQAVRTIPGPGVLECPQCGQMTALRQLNAVSPRSLVSATGLCGVSIGGCAISSSSRCPE